MDSEGDGDEGGLSGGGDRSDLRGEREGGRWGAKLLGGE